jgi:hypothetical protein
MLDGPKPRTLEPGDIVGSNNNLADTALMVVQLDFKGEQANYGFIRLCDGVLTTARYKSLEDLTMECANDDYYLEAELHITGFEFLY